MSGKNLPGNHPPPWGVKGRVRVRLGIALDLGSAGGGGGGAGFRGDFFLETLFPKIAELRNIAKLSNVAAIDVSELKLDDSFLSFEIHNDN